MNTDAHDSTAPDGSERYRDLASQHHALDTRLHELSSKPYLSASEELEEHTLKKRKLALKDRMERLARVP